MLLIDTTDLAALTPLLVVSNELVLSFNAASIGPLATTGAEGVLLVGTGAGTGAGTGLCFRSSSSFFSRTSISSLSFSASSKALL